MSQRVRRGSVARGYPYPISWVLIVGRTVGPDDLCIRRQVFLLDDDSTREATVAHHFRQSRERLIADPRLDLPERPALLDSPTAHAFTIGDEEFIAGTTASVADQIIDQCRRTGAGHFAASFDRQRSPDQLKVWHDRFGAGAIPLLKSATI